MTTKQLARLLAAGWVLTFSAAAKAQAGPRPQLGGQEASADSRDENKLVIQTETLPPAFPQTPYFLYLRAVGGVPPLHWAVDKGELPPGSTLEKDGLLQGSPIKAGIYHFTVSVTDSSVPSQVVKRDFTLNVVAALVLQWKVPPHVTGNRIEGSVKISSGAPAEMDLTFVVLAVNEIGRATAIGYQHFPLKPNTSEFEISFGETLPNGAYVVHADAVGEVAKKHQIFRARLQTPGPLQVTTGP